MSYLIHENSEIVQYCYTFNVIDEIFTYLKESIKKLGDSLNFQMKFDCW